MNNSNNTFIFGFQATKNVPLDHLLEDDKYPAIVHVSSLAAGKDFSHIADRKGWF